MPLLSLRSGKKKSSGFQSHSSFSSAKLSGKPQEQMKKLYSLLSFKRKEHGLMKRTNPGSDFQVGRKGSLLEGNDFQDRLVRKRLEPLGTRLRMDSLGF